MINWLVPERVRRGMGQVRRLFRPARQIFSGGVGMKRPDDGKLDEPISRRRLLKIGALTTASLLIPGAALAEDWIRIHHERMPIEPVQRPIVRRSGVRQSGYTIRQN